MEKFTRQIKASLEGQSYHSVEFNQNFWTICYDWIIEFKKSLEISNNKDKWTKVDTFIVIPVDAKNETRLYNTLIQYSKDQDLDKSKYGFVIFLNSKDGVNIAQSQVEEFKRQYPDINITFYFHKFLESEIQNLDIAKIRNVGYNFVSLIAKLFRKASNEVVLIGADADTIKVSNNYLSTHRDLNLSKENQYICITSKWFWGLTGDIFYDFFLINYQFENGRETEIDQTNTDKFPSESGTSFPLESYDKLQFLETEIGNVCENTKFVELSKITAKPRLYTGRTSFLTDPRRAINFINSGGDLLDLNQMWNQKNGNWGRTGDEARGKNNLEIRNQQSDKDQLIGIVKLIFETNLANFIQSYLIKEWDYEEITTAIVENLNEQDVLNPNQLTAKAIELRDVAFNVLLQIIIVSVGKTITETKRILENFKAISADFNSDHYIKSLIDSNEFSLAVEQLFVKLFALSAEQNPFEEIEGDDLERKAVELNDSNIGDLKPIHEIVEVLMCSFGMLTKNIAQSNQTSVLLSELYDLGHPFDSFIDYEKFLQTIRSYQEKQCVDL